MVKVGDTVFIVNSNPIDKALPTGSYRVSKINDKYFEIGGNRFYKFIQDPIDFERSGQNKGKRTKDDFKSTVMWYPSIGIYTEIIKRKENMEVMKNFISKHLYLFNYDELKVLFNELKDLKGE